MKWRPMETAPKDGTPILVCIEGYDGYDYGLGPHPLTVAWITYHPNVPGKACWRDSNGHKRVGHTHWMPLPKAPKAAKKPSKAT